MTPAKEKAIELVSKFENSIGWLEGNEWWESSKECALVAVDEMIDRLQWHTGASDLGNTIILEDIHYWQEVKQEIINLN